MAKMKPNWLPIIIGIIAGYLVFAKLYDWRPFGREMLEEGLYSNRSQNREETFGWEVYRSEEFDFEFKYPDTWTIREFNSETSPTIFVSKDNFDQLVIHPKGDPNSNPPNNPPLNLEPVTKETRIGGKAVLWKEWILPQNQLVVYGSFKKYPVTWTKDNLLYLQTIDNKSVIDQMLSTFKFR